MLTPFAHLSDSGVSAGHLVLEEAVTHSIASYWRVFIESSGCGVSEVDGARGLHGVSDEVALDGSSVGIGDLERSLSVRGSGSNSGSRSDKDGLSELSGVSNLGDLDVEVGVVHQLPLLDGGSGINGRLEVVPVVGHE